MTFLCAHFPKNFKLLVILFDVHCQTLVSDLLGGSKACRVAKRKSYSRYICAIFCAVLGCGQTWACLQLTIFQKFFADVSWTPKKYNCSLLIFSVILSLLTFLNTPRLILEIWIFEKYQSARGFSQKLMIIISYQLQLPNQGKLIFGFLLPWDGKGACKHVEPDGSSQTDDIKGGGLGEE